MGAQAVRLSNVDIDNALKNKDFEVLFQPIFDLGNGALARVETFVRWRHQSLGVLPPGAFISFFETQGRMSELTRYVLAEALSAYQSWRGPYPPGFSINLALSDLSDESFSSHFTVLLRESGFPTELVTLECPMPPVDADVGATARQLQRLGETGARLAIEVRGRANDFLKTVRPFPFAEIKTGGAAILRFARTVRGPGLSAISELLELAAEQKAAITAVGVEDQASLAALRGLGFAAAQGNHLGKVGALTQFMPSQVNDVRALLGLEKLSSEDLTALFRTGGPALAPTQASAAPEVAVEAVAAVAAQEVPGKESEDALVERLAARIARADAAGGRRSRVVGEDADARAAAIARARRKNLIRERLASRNALKSKAEARDESAAPREMQERLTREFEAFTTDGATSDADAFDHPQSRAARHEPVGAEAPEPAAMTPGNAGAAAAFAETHLSVPNASAHFKPTIRVSGPEMRSDAEIGELHREEAFERSAEDAPPAPEETPAASEPAAETETAVGIPPVRPGAQWVEDTVAVVARAEPARKKRQNVLSRKYRLLPKMSGYFWPRWIRRLAGE